MTFKKYDPANDSLLKCANCGKAKEDHHVELNEYDDESLWCDGFQKQFRWSIRNKGTPAEEWDYGG